MLLLALVASVGAIAGLARPRVGAHTPRPALGGVPLLGGGAILNGASLLLDGRSAVLILAASIVLLVAFTVVNRHVTGLAVVGVGLLANLAPLTVDVGMPVRPGALVRAGLVSADAIADTGLRGARHLETDQDRLGGLGDTLPVPPLREVLSFGDLIVIAGAGDALRDLSRRRGRRPSPVAPPRHLATPRRRPAGGSTPTEVEGVRRPASTPRTLRCPPAGTHAAG